jgi:hypothetical protein
MRHRRSENGVHATAVATIVVAFVLSPPEPP